MTAGDNEPSNPTPYRWVCPLCRVSRAGIAGADEQWKSKAVHSLKTHIRARADDSHGPLGSMPSAIGDDDLLGWVEVPDRQ